MASEKIMSPIHPGELLKEELPELRGITTYQLAKDVGIPAPRVYDVVVEKRWISADTGLRLNRYFGLNKAYWIRLQARHDQLVAEDELGEKIEHEVRPLSKA